MTDGYTGVERRIRCDGHEKLMEQSVKNHTIIENVQKQLDEMHKDLQASTELIAELNRIVRNGLTSRVTETHESMEKLCRDVESISTEHDNRIKVLEEFAWFRKMVTKVRDNMFWTVIKVSALLFFIMIMVNLADRTVVSAIVKMIFGV